MQELVNLLWKRKQPIDERMEELISSQARAALDARVNRMFGNQQSVTTYSNPQQLYPPRR